MKLLSQYTHEQCGKYVGALRVQVLVYNSVYENVHFEM